MSRDLLSVEEAQARILGAVASPLEAGEVPVADALGRTLAAPVVAAVSLPPWDNSAMDGYAIRAADVARAGDAAPIRLEVVGEVPAGRAAERALAAGEAIRIATGAPLPHGADAVVPVEDTTPLDASGPPGLRGRDAVGPPPAAILVHSAPVVGSHIRREGGDIRVGETILEAGTDVGPEAIALAAGAGVGTLIVHRRPVVAVLATGDEVRGAGERLGPAGIPDANGPALRALARQAGADVLDLGIARDVLEDVIARLRSATDAGADLIVVAGGVSVGPYDVVRSAFEALGRVDLWRVAVQPGKPFAFGTAERPSGRPPVLLFGLPGNPVSAFVTFELFVRPAVRRLGGRRRTDRPSERAVLLDEARKSPGRRAYLRVTVERGPDGEARRDELGRPLVRLARGPAGQGSHVLSALAGADALAIVPEVVSVHPAGGEVGLLWLDRP